MDDLLGEDWQKPSKPATSTTPSLTPTPSFNAPRSQTQTPISIPVLPQSGRSTPQSISRPSSTLNSNGAAKSDQFGALLGLKSGKATTSNVSIQERQRQLVEERRKQQEQQAHMWDSLGGGNNSGSGKASGTGTPNVMNGEQVGQEEDIFAAFSKDAPVNKASHFPPPSTASPSVPAETGGFDDDDDPFGLGALPKVSNGHRNVESTPIADDDVLGDLGKPVEQRPAIAETAARPPREPTPDNATEDGVVTELVDMGFPLDNAKIALAESGGDVQRAVGWLLQQAHEESKQKARKEEPTQRHRDPQSRSRENREAEPQWMRPTDRSSSAARRHDSRSPAAREKDAAAVAQELGNKLFKGANSLWKASQKQMAKTVADFQGGSATGEASSQPKWMQETSGDPSRSTSQRREGKQRQPEKDVTDEAAMLDMPRDRPMRPARPDSPPTYDMAHRAAQAQVKPRFMQQAPPVQDKRPATKLSRNEAEEQSAQAYISPARRKRPTPTPTPAAEVDLFSPAPAAPANRGPSSKPLPSPSTARPAQAQAHRPPPSPRPQVAPRTIPQVSSTALRTSAIHRSTGTESFKRGDYASAHESYTSALAGIPQQHPIAIVILCNRALTALKTGDPKAAIVDAERALSVIGPGNGTGETVEEKPMQEFWGKAVMRKAEGLEALEKWPEAAQAWRTAVEAGVGGAIAARGRDRCEKAGAPKSKPVAASKPPPPNAKPAARKPGPGEAAAIASLRAANAAAAQEEDAKFAATDAVDARLTAWKSGKSDNLRALLQSLDQVLWEGAGWKKVGMSDLILPGKVKIVYMKAIGRVHPDKVSLLPSPIE